MTQPLTDNVLFSYRAENLDMHELFHLYTAPSYFPELLGPLPCFLQGGRGTGKTTVLRYLSYEAKSFVATKDPSFHGLYIKFERSEISAFRGAGLDDDQWTKWFSHYINLIQCLALLEYVNNIYENKPMGAAEPEFSRFLRALQVEQCNSLKDAIESIYMLIIDLQTFINDTHEKVLNPSILGVPLKYLIAYCDNKIPNFTQKPIAFLFDEYEVLENYQQRVVNTLVKQANSRLTYKIGVREEGIRERVVIGGDQEVRTPADYVLIKIEVQLRKKKGWEDFATKVVCGRLNAEWAKCTEPIQDLEKLFPGYTYMEEAEKLGIKKVADSIRKEKSLVVSLSALSDFEVFFANFIATPSRGGLQGVIETIRDSQNKYNVLLNNYGYASLFTLKPKSPGLTKYYCGWKTLCKMADGNIRYVLQLVSTMLVRHKADCDSLCTPIPQRLQTQCCREIGKEILLDCEGISLSGARLMKLVLGLGKIFHELAATAEGHGPEITQFEISNEAEADEEELEEVRQILRDAVMHLVLVRIPGTKLGGAADTRTFDYMLHPIFAAFFQYSYRRKRKMGLTTSEFIGLIKDPKPTINQILKRHNRSVTEEKSMLLELFGDDYESRL